MNCRECIQFLADYVEGALPAHQAAVFNQHMIECPDCVAYIESYEQTIRMSKSACECPEDQLDCRMPDSLVKAILDARRHGT